MMNTTNKDNRTYDEQKYVTDVYDKIASQFNQTRKFQWSWISDFLKNINGFYIDIGCGGGRNLNNKSLGIDNCQTFVDMVNKQGLKAVKADMINLPLQNECADAILSIASFHHLNSEDRRIKALNEMKRVLKSDGQILLSVWSINQPDKTRRQFKKYGDTIVPWKRPQGNEIFERYYYIFQLLEINNLFQKVGLKVKSYQWDCGNEIFILTK
jgi:tRNA (uracil-5-)-methyltransferase TRM9